MNNDQIPADPDPGESAASKLSDEGDKLTSEARSVQDAAKRKSQEAFESIKQSGKNVARDAGDYAKQVTAEQKNSLVSKLNDYRAAADAAQEKLKDEENSVAADTVNRAAGMIGKVTDYLENRDPKDLFDDLSDTTRKHPELVFGGLFILGLGAARFFKASSANHRSDSSYDADRRVSQRVHTPARTHVEMPVSPPTQTSNPNI